MSASLGDLSGQVFGWWLVLAPAPSSNGHKQWYCLCLNCEPKRGIIEPSIHIVSQSNLVSGASVQCRACSHTTHGGSYTAEHRAWREMQGRCKRKPGYIAKGITVCKRWRGRDGFKNFLEDMGPRPQGAPGEWSVGRINPLGNYEKDNCRWETIDQQAREKTNNVVLNVNGVEMVKEDWAQETGISTGAITYRLGQGKSHEEAVLAPSKTQKAEERTREDGETERKCKHCGQWKVLITEYHKCSKGSGGYASKCSECKNAAERKRDTAKRRAEGAQVRYKTAQRIINGRDERWCGACPPNGAWKPIEQFGIDKGVRRSSRCKSCHSAQRKVVCREPHDSEGT